MAIGRAAIPGHGRQWARSAAAVTRAGPAELRPARDGFGAGTTITDFSACYAQELPSLVWFVMSLGADAHRAADVAQSTFAEAFAVWDRIQHPTAWLRRVAGRLYCRNLVAHETSVEDVPDRQGPLLAAGEAELRIRARPRSRLHFLGASHVELRR